MYYKHNILHKLHILIITITSILISDICNAQYIRELYVGDETIISAPTPPMNSALFQTAWGSSCSGISVQKYNEFGAKVKILQYFSGIGQVQCDYYYFWYNNGRQYTKRATTFYNFKCKQATISLSTTILDLEVGKGYKLKYSITPSNISPTPTVTWSSSNYNIVSVNDGYITANRPGRAIIYATTSHGTSASCVVTVPDVPPTDIKVSPSSISLSEGQSATVLATLVPDYASSQITWSSDNTGIATVYNGTVTGISVGSTKIKATTTNGHSASCSIKVTPQAKEIHIPDSTTVIVGYSSALTPKLVPENATSTFKWSSNNYSVASVTNKGIITGKSVGSAIITVRTDNGLASSCKVTVKESPVNIAPYTVTNRVQRIKTLINKTLTNLQNEKSN